MTLIHPFAPRSHGSIRVSIILVTHHKVGQIVFSVRVPAMVWKESVVASTRLIR